MQKTTVSPISESEFVYEIRVFMTLNQSGDFVGAFWWCYALFWSITLILSSLPLIVIYV